MVQKYGAMSLYDGLSAGLCRQLVYASSRFGLFESMRDKLHEYRGKTDFGARVVLGAASGGMAAYLSCPMEVSCVRLSNDVTLPLADRKNYKGVVDTATRIAKEEGISAFWRGSTPFVNRAMMVGVFQVATYDQFKQMFSTQFGQKKDSVMNVFSAAMTSGLIYSFVTMPLEATKNRMASQKMDPVTKKLPYTGMIQCITTVSKKEGFMALYNGYLPYYVRCGGHTVGMFIAVQLLRDFYFDHLN
jgi:solute carrier family 25 oxoglutarate transporter 11